MISTEMLVLDLETITDPRIPVPEPKHCGTWLGAIQCGHPTGGCPQCGTAPDVFLPPTFHQIVAIGYARVLNWRITELDVLCGLPFPAERAEMPLGPLWSPGIPFPWSLWSPGSEPKALADITQHIAVEDPQIIGWNSRGFDMPVIAARCLAHGIPFPWYYGGPKFGGPRYRYADVAHYDVKDFLGDYGAGRSASLDAVAKSIGLPGKVGVDGSMVAAMVAEGRVTEMLDYCLCDVVQTWGVALRMALVRGQISVDTYRAAAKHLVQEVIVKNPRVKALATGIDAGRFWLEDV